MSDQTSITDGEGKLAVRNTCGSCGACELAPGNNAICRRNPPGRGPTGAALWPNINPEKDWCTQWIPRQ